jgi:hypothetical protein
MRCSPLLAALLLLSASPAAADDAPLGHRKSAWENPTFARQRGAAMKLGDDYRAMIGTHKTEREFVRASLAWPARATAPFGRRRPFDAPQTRPGTRFYAVVHDKLLPSAWSAAGR